MTTIETQIAKDNATINNAEQINNNFFDEPLKFFCDKKISERPDLEPYFKIVQYMINKDNLKQRFGGVNYKYKDLIGSLERHIDTAADLKPNELDDGYKSVIKCIVKIISLFTIQEIESKFKFNDTDLYAEITGTGLKIKYSEEVKTYERYNVARKKANQIITDLAPFLNCATQYGNIFQFNNIFLDEIKNVPFITEEIKFNVSNKIIPNLIKPLYGESPECGLREIIQNACDATKQLHEKKSSINLLNKIEVRLFEENRRKKISIRDYGIGMTKEILLNKYFVIGESSKKDSNLNLVGQFGIGALAAFLLGDDIEVKTKYYNQEKIFHFTYTLSSEQDKSINIAIKDDDFLHGTQVTIALNDQLSNLSEMDIKKKLKIDEWYILPDIPIEFYIEEKKHEIYALNGESFSWKTLETSIDNVEVKYLEKDSSSKVILNGLMVPEKYNFQCKYLRVNPYISIKSFGQALKLNLERSRIENGLTPILDILQKQLIKLGLDEFQKDRDSIIDKKLKINYFKYNNEYLKNIPLFFTNEGFGVYSKKIIDRIQISKTVSIYGYNGYPNIHLHDLDNDTLYLFSNDIMQKSNIADLIQNYGSVYLPNEIIKQYFYNATNQYNGFRYDAMKKLYIALNMPEPAYNLVSEFWENHNKNKEAYFSGFFDEPESILVGDNVTIDEGNLFYDLCQSNIIHIHPRGFNSNKIIYDDIDSGFVKVK